MIRTLSEHLALEIEASQVGRPLGESQPVPGCTCNCCVIGSFGLEDDTQLITEDLVRDLSRLKPVSRRAAANAVITAWLEFGVALPSAPILAELASRVQGARKDRTAHTNTLPVDTARAVPILETAKRLGLELRQTGRSWRGPCPVHGGEQRNFSIDPKRGIFKCFVCGVSGDVIELEQRITGLGFADAVRQLAR